MAIRTGKEVKDIRTRRTLLSVVMTIGMGFGAPAASQAALAEPIYLPFQAEVVQGGTNAVCVIVSAASASPGFSWLPAR